MLDAAQSTGTNSGEALRRHIAAIQRANNERKLASQRVREANAAAKADGFDPKIIRFVLNVKEREEDPEAFFQNLDAMATFLEVW